MKKATLITVAFLLLAAATIFFANRKRGEWIEEKRFQMATVTKIVIPNVRGSRAALRDAFAAIDEVERMASRFIPDSEINEVNKGGWHKLSPLFLPMWKEADKLYKLSEGRFDVTAGRLVSLWGFGPEGREKTPTEEEIQEALKYTGFDKVILSNDHVYLPPGMQVDFNSLAAGYAADKAADALMDHGFTDYLVDAGGEIVCSSVHGHVWKIGVKDPESEEETAVLPLELGAVSTSGSYANFYKSGSNSFTHIVDAKTGKAAKTSLLSVSVNTSTGLKADGMSTLLFVLPPEEAKKLVGGEGGLPAMFIEEEEGRLKVTKNVEWLRREKAGK
jgi:thiamine biosynthesis lipoprotein